MAMATVQGSANAAAASGSGGKTKLIVLGLGALLLLGGGGAGAAWMLGLFGGHAAEAAAPADAGHGAAADGGHGAAADEGGHGGKSAGPAVAFVDLPDVIVNLQPTASRMRFLKLKVALEVASEGEAEAVRALTPRIMDSFQLYLRALTVEEVQGAAGMQRLKEEMLARVHRAVEPLRIEDVLFKEMLVQ
jgi:flagellar FliL protein